MSKHFLPSAVSRLLRRIADRPKRRPFISRRTEVCEVLEHRQLLTATSNISVETGETEFYSKRIELPADFGSLAEIIATPHLGSVNVVMDGNVYLDYESSLSGEDSFEFSSTIST